MYWLPYSSYRPLIIPHRLPAFLKSLMPLTNWCSIHARWSKSSLKHSLYVSVTFFSKFKTEFKRCIVYRSSKGPHCIFEIQQLWQSGFSKVYSVSSCSCWFEPEIIKIGQSSHKMYSNNILNFQVSTTILNACTKKYGNLLNVFVKTGFGIKLPTILEMAWNKPNQTTYIYIYIYDGVSFPVML